MKRIHPLIIAGLLVALSTAEGQPSPGDLFREYIWLPKMVAEQGKFLRVGGRLDYKTSSDHFPSRSHQDGYIPLLHELDLRGAVRAEMVVEKLASHEDTKNLRVSVNRNPSLTFPAARGIPEPESDYMHHTCPVVEVPLDHLKEGLGNSFRFDVDTVQRWAWPQNIIYGVILRIYYHPEKASGKPSIEGVTGGESLREGHRLRLSGPDASIYRVQYIGYYEDVNWEGDGIYRQWHYHYFRGQVVHHIGTAGMYPFEVIWNTSWLPDQEDIRVAARVTGNDGLIYFTKAVEGLKLERDYSVELCRPFDQPKNWVTREDEFEAKFRLRTDPSKIAEAKAFWTSWSPCYSNGVYINGERIFDREELCYEYRAHEVDINDPAILRKGTNLIRTGKEPLHDGQMVHGMEVQWPGIMVKVKTHQKPHFKASVETYEGRPHFAINTPEVTYYYDIKGGGFSRIIDRDGNDWVSFKMEPWDEYPGSAAGSFRGLPNMVFQGEDNGAGHPGHDQCESWLEEKKIVTESLSGKWKWSWDFFEDHAVLRVLKADPDRAYWFLYEGTPGGRFDPGNTYFGTSLGGPESLRYDYYTGTIFRKTFRWIYTGQSGLNRIFYMIQCNQDEWPDMASLLGNSEKGMESRDGMTVIGFGRGKQVNRYLTGRQSFIIGMYPQNIGDSTSHRVFSEFLHKRFLDH